MPPGGSLADEQPFSKQRLQHPEGCTAAAVGLWVIHQHMTDRLRRVEDHGGAPEDAADDHFVLVGSLRPGHRQLTKG